MFETPTPGHLAAGGGTPLNFRETPTPGRSKAQWGGKTPFGGGNTPYGGFGGATPNTPGN